MISVAGVVRELSDCRSMLAHAGTQKDDSGYREVVRDGVVLSEQADHFGGTAVTLRNSPVDPRDRVQVVWKEGRQGDISRQIIAAVKNAHGGDMWTRSTVSQVTTVHPSGGAAAPQVMETYEFCPSLPHRPVTALMPPITKAIGTELSLRDEQRKFLAGWNIAV